MVYNKTVKKQLTLLSSICTSKECCTAIWQLYFFSKVTDMKLVYKLVGTPVKLVHLFTLVFTSIFFFFFFFFFLPRYVTSYACAIFDFRKSKQMHKLSLIQLPETMQNRQYFSFNPGQYSIHLDIFRKEQGVWGVCANLKDKMQWVARSLRWLMVHKPVHVRLLGYKYILLPFEPTTVIAWEVNTDELIPIREKHIIYSQLATLNYDLNSISDDMKFFDRKKLFFTKR